MLFLHVHVQIVTLKRRQHHTSCKVQCSACQVVKMAQMAPFTDECGMLFLHMCMHVQIDL